MKIHPTAVIGDNVELAEDVSVGPYAVLDGEIKIGRGSTIMAHAVICGYTELGEKNIVHMGAVLGHEPQDMAFGGERSYLKIGNNNVFREQSYIHRGTKPESATVIGDNNYFMAHSHAGHNCVIGNNCIIVNNSLLAGYVELGDNVFISGNVVIHQFCRIGSYSIISGLSAVNKDIPPFIIGSGRPAYFVGLNSVGLRRGGFKPDQRSVIKQAYKIIYGQGYAVSKAVRALEQMEPSAELSQIIDFIAGSKRGICSSQSNRSTLHDSLGE